MNADPIKHVSDTFLTPPESQEWLRSFPMLKQFGAKGPVTGAIVTQDQIPQLDSDYWQRHTKALESHALTKCSDANIDGLFYEVTTIIDEDLTRFDPMVAHFGQHYPDGDSTRIQIESEVAGCVKRDLAWMMVEELIGERGFFSGLKRWYDLGRWPHAWDQQTGQIVLK
ncbi:MAG: hypothetical protein ACR2NK_17340 [Mariniblastus sp.]